MQYGHEHKKMYIIMMTQGEGGVIEYGRLLCVHSLVR